MRKKRYKYEQLGKRYNVLETGNDLFDNIHGNWSDFFQNNNDIVLELACGRGEYSIGLSEVFSTKNFIGIDVKGDRLWEGSLAAEEKGLSNVAFLRTKIEELENLFDPREVSEIWIVFPDPRPKGRDERRRLTSPRFLKTYQKVLKTDGLMHLKTDNTGLYEFTLDTLNAREDIEILDFTRDLYLSDLNAQHYGIKTHYERKHFDLGETIKYIKFKFRTMHE